MAITGITVVETDLDDYSQYERDRDTITVRVIGTPAQPLLNDQITIDLIKARRNRDVVVASQIYTFDGVVNDFNTNGVEVTFYLPDVRTAPDLIRLMKAGKYFAKAEDTATELITASSDDFDVSIITVSRLRSDYLFGLDLQANEVRGWKLPPANITGVTLSEVSRAHPLALYSLTYTVSGARSSLSWAGGDDVTVNAGGVRDYMLPAPIGQDYVIVRVDPRLLSTTSQVDQLFVEEKQIEDETLRRYIQQAVSQVEDTTLQVYLEPTRCVTDIDPTQITFSSQNLSPIVLDADFDFITTPVTYYAPNSAKWIDIQLPMYHVLRVDSLFGAVANTRVVDINLEWVELAEKQGFVQLVPFNQEIAFDFIGLVFVESLRGAVEIPSFWRYNVLAGLRDVPGDVQELIGRMAAIPVLTVAGQAFRSGYSSQSISRDGVSESVSYTASAIYGIYSASIEDHRRWIKDHVKDMRAKYRGLNLMVV